LFFNNEFIISISLLAIPKLIFEELVSLTESDLFIFLKICLSAYSFPQESAQSQTIPHPPLTR
jgi:hypothetical protein